MASSTATRNAPRNATSNTAKGSRGARAATPATARRAQRPTTPARAAEPVDQPQAAPEAPVAVAQTPAPTDTTIEGLESLLRQLVQQRAGTEPHASSSGIRQAGGESFKLGTEQLASILTSRGRRAMRSVYHDDMLTAIANPGTYYGITIEPPLKAAWIISQIRKAARECGLNTRQYSTYNKSAEGFVSYVVHQPATPPQTVRSGSEGDR